ncbi:hypothetical protein [Glutamicibacter sp. V16R2B1]|uniref:hypothetical protein n=1 Tax=Glutamicibacter sp. V16R2B1 TaxID=2036207 RepID=UPI0010FEAE6A|nr:hypothetical protein [Glutamicibacter sp. V16R2B1]MCK9901351.1 hypothetical protein [Frankia sp. Cpl3]TLK47798.1 hypothetical protein FDN03_15560 [Glutamicibacter sp. V16R2B1]
MDYTATPYSDRCDLGECYRARINEIPTKVAIVDGAYLANYTCSRCGYEWATSWMAGGYGEVADQWMRSLAESTRAAGLPMLPPGGRRHPARRSA